MSTHYENARRLYNEAVASGDISDERYALMLMREALNAERAADAWWHESHR